MSNKRCYDCGGELRFNATIIGTTVGGLRLRGWDECQTCGRAWLSRRGVPDEGGAWTLARGGMSVNAGTTRIRFHTDGDREIVTELAARVVRLPDLERALVRIAAGAEEDPPALARSVIWPGERHYCQSESCPGHSTPASTYPHPPKTCGRSAARTRDR